MIKVLFVCLGNICRSPLAEFLMKHKLREAGLEHMFEISSAATSSYEVGNDMHIGSKQVLRDNGVKFTKRCARKVLPSDYYEYDYIIYMDQSNYSSLMRIFGHDDENKLYSMMSFAGLDSDVADPWYTGDFDKTYSDIDRALDSFINQIVQKEN